MFLPSSTNPTLKIQKGTLLALGINAKIFYLNIQTDLKIVQKRRTTPSK
jgi:hypothetical protein